MQISEIIEKRKAIWKKRRSISYDRELCFAAAEKIMTSEDLRSEIKAKPYLLIEAILCIVDKNKETVPFFLNDVQRDFLRQMEENGTGKPFFILKGRQQGFTSLITAMQLTYAIVSKNFSGFTVADNGGNTRAIFNDKGRMVYERLPELLKPTERYNSVNELYFDKLNSSWRIATATDNVGRSRTLNFVHFSEVAFYECRLADLQKGIGEAMIKDAFCVYETTANGFNEAKELWDSETCINLFYGWWRTEEYRSNELDYLSGGDAWISKRRDMLFSLGLEKEQVAWYCKKYACYLDKTTIRQEYPCSPEEAFVSSGISVFDSETVQNRILSLPRKDIGRRGFFRYKRACTQPAEGGVVWKLSNIEFVESPDGYIVLHEKPRVRTGEDGRLEYAPYAIGGDTAGSGADSFTAKVIDVLTGKSVATLKKRLIDEDLYAEQMYCLGWYYNNALIGIETNYSRYPTRVLTQKYCYSNVYMREKLDSESGKIDRVAGFETTSRTKKIIIGNLVELIRECPEIECDLETLKEMLSFVRKDNGKQEAANGAHDDLVMASAIGHFIAKSVPSEWIKRPAEDYDFISRNFRSEESDSEYITWED